MRGIPRPAAGSLGCSDSSGIIITMVLVTYRVILIGKVGMVMR